MTSYRPIFATREPLRIAVVRRLLTGAGIAADPQVVLPDELERVVMGAGNCLVIVDGQAPPNQDMLHRLRRNSPASRIVIWTDCLTTELLLTTIECGLAGLLSSRLPPEEACCALARICRGERMLRFDSDPVSLGQLEARPLADAPLFDAQWMMHGAEPQGREK